jgi:sterol desaturase/sphingolipid hydroxylase (fatty acid hydroxylase superfamily)
MLEGLLQFWLREFGVAAGKYLAVGGVLTLLYSQTWLRLNYVQRATSQPVRDNWLRVLLTLQTLLIYSSFGLILLFVQRQFGFSPVYTNIEERGWPYFFFSIALMMVSIDAIFYWAHRVMHWRPVYIRVHKLHHRFINVTPWTTYSFHFYESLVDSVLVFFLPLMFFPWHPAALAVYTTINITWSTYLHAGYDFIPKKWQNHVPFRWFYSSTHHSLHHQYGLCNYGLYFAYWDRSMGTERLP